MNQNPYLLWAKKIRIGFPYWDNEATTRLFVKSNPWMKVLEGGKFPRQNERIKATYNGVAPYTVQDLEGGPLRWATNLLCAYNYGPKFKSDMLAALAFKKDGDLDQALQQIRESLGDAVTFDYFSDEILVTIDRSKL